MMSLRVCMPGPMFLLGGSLSRGESMWRGLCEGEGVSVKGDGDLPVLTSCASH